RQFRHLRRRTQTISAAAPSASNTFRPPHPPPPAAAPYVRGDETMQPRSAPPPPVNFTSIVSRPPNRINPNNRMSNAGASLLRYQDQYLYDDRYFFNEEEVALILELSDDDDDVVVLDDSNNFTGGGGGNTNSNININNNGGLSERTISQNLRTRSSLEVNVDNYEQEVCVICQDDLFGEHENIIATLDCGHVYHVECIKKWLRSKNECPICKARALNFN
ncbi:hypothetical protein MIMGU_mgv1a024255mg, partial [Erythranthe guttata]